MDGPAQECAGAGHFAGKDDGGGGFNPTMFVAHVVQNYKLPAVEAANLAGYAKELKQDTDWISGGLTEAGAKELLSFRWRDGDAPTVSNPKGSAKFWIKDGGLVKYQFHVSGTINFNGDDHDIDRTTTVVVKDVDTTKIDVSDEVKKKLE